MLKKTKLAQQVDKHQLYELAVQCPEAEIEFINQTFQALKDRPAYFLREDFCGTAQLCCEWIKQSDQHYAIGVDLDLSVLQWSHHHRIAQLQPKQRDRLQLIHADVLNVSTAMVDVICAMNFSYWLLMQRQQLKRYFNQVYTALVSDGILFLDIYGGYDSFRTIEESRMITTPWGEVEYIWDQYYFNPVNHELHCAIHFCFEDGSRLDKAFDYHWRLWTLPEISDLLEECGFKVTAYWQGWEEDGEPDGQFKPVTEADDDAGWVAYIVAEKQCLS